ncbi:MAG: hypothetical protein ACPGXI_10710 [Mycobacterium sp.]
MTAATMGATVFEKSTSDARPNDEPAPPKRMNPKHLRRTLYWLTLDWIHLHEHLPTPTQSDGPKRTSNVKDYGHPAEWASDTARDIADKLTSWHDMLAEHRNETQPRRKLMNRNKDGNDIWTWAVNEQQRLTSAWRYLEPRCEQLTQLVDKDALQELPELHHRIRSVLGQYVPKYTIPVPCPNDECGLRTLMRVMGVGQDFIACDACGYMIKDVHYPLLVKMTLDAFLAANPQTGNCTGTVDATDTSVSNPPEHHPQRSHHRHWGFLVC